MHFRPFDSSLRNRPQIHNPNGTRQTQQLIHNWFVCFISFLKTWSSKTKNHKDLTILQRTYTPSKHLQWVNPQSSIWPCQYRIWPPLLSIQASTRDLVLLIKFLMILCRIACHSCLTACYNCWWRWIPLSLRTSPELIPEILYRWSKEGWCRS